MRMTLNQLADLVSEETGVDIRSRSRKTKYVVARAIFFDIAYNHMSMGSLHQIGEVVDKDHASVLHSLRTMVPQMKRYFKDGHAINLKLQHELKIAQEDPYEDLVKMVRSIPEDNIEQLKIRLDAIIQMI